MQHLSEDQFVLYHYGEAVDRGAIDAHLASCEACRSGYQALQDLLAAVDAAPVPERLESYGTAMWLRLEPRLPRPWRLVWHWPRWALAGAMAALLVGAFLAGRFSPRDPATPPGQVRERILLVAVGDHLERSQLVLIELANATGNGSVDISAEQQWAEDLLDANRLYRHTAARAGETAVASVLDDLERVLLEIAHSPARLPAERLDELQRRIESEGLLFKVRVIGSKVRARQPSRDREGAVGL